MSKDERESPKTIEWYKAQADEKADIWKRMFHIWKEQGIDMSDDFYFPEKLEREYKNLLKKVTKLEKNE